MDRIGLLTIHDTINFGSQLQTYGLYKAVESLGCDVKLIDYKCDAIAARESTLPLREAKNIKDVVKSLILHGNLEKRKENFHQFMVSHMSISQEYSLFKYHNQTLMGTFVGDSSHYKMLLIVLLVPLAKLCLDNGGTKWLFKMMNVFAALLYFLVAVQFVIYNLNKTVFLHAMSAGSDIPLLNGTLRISLSWIGNLMILYNFHMFYKDTKDKQTNKVKHFVLFAIGFVELIVISRVRGTTLAVTIGILVLIFADRSTQKTMMKKMLIVVILLCGFFGTDIVSNFLDSFSLDATRAYSTTARLYAIDFYWSAFLKNPLFGIGFADGTVNATVVHGDGRANVSDVGIFAQIAKYSYGGTRFLAPPQCICCYLSFAILPQPVPAPYFSGVFSGKTRRMHIQCQKYLSGMAYSVFKELRKVLFSLTLTLI